MLLCYLATLLLCLMKLMLTTDPFFADVYNKKVLKDLEQRFGPTCYQHADLSISTEIMLGMVNKMKRKKPRRGEVVMVVPNEQGHIWLHTKSFYPQGAYRLMTGGLEPGEAPDEALRREVEEETGFKIKPKHCLAVITYSLSTKEVKLPFVSYVFATTPAKGQPHPTDSGEAIEHFQAVPAAALADTARQLRLLSGAFAGRELELNKALTTLGRPGVQVAAITRRAEGYFIVHVDSGKEGDYPLVNGTPIGPQARRLRDNDVIQLAGVKMGFFES